MPSRLNASVISVHVPKAGGTSLRYMLNDAFQERLLLDYGHDITLYDEVELDRLPDGFSAVHGHFTAWRYDKVPDAFRFTFLRHPISNFISIYFYWKSLSRFGHELHDRFLDEQPSIVDLARWKSHNNFMTKLFFKNYDMSRLHFVGFHEKRREDLIRLGEMIGVSFDVDLHQNRTEQSSEREELESDNKILGQLGHIMREDIEFYDKHLARRKCG